MGHLQVWLLRVAVVHQKLGGVVGRHGLAFGKHLLAHPGGPLALPLIPLLLLGPAQLQVGPPVAFALGRPPAVLLPAQHGFHRAAPGVLGPGAPADPAQATASPGGIFLL